MYRITSYNVCYTKLLRAKFIEDVSYDFSEKILLINDLNSADEAYDLFKTGLPAIECVPSAIATFLRTDTFKDGMISCVNAGGDTRITSYNVCYTKLLRFFRKRYH